MAPTIEDTAALLAHAHRDADSSTKLVKHFPGAFGVVRLLEVSSRSPTIGEVRPFRFTADPEGGVPYPSELILVSEEEWKKIETGELQLPPDWDLDSAQDL